MNTDEKPTGFYTRKTNDMPNLLGFGWLDNEGAYHYAEFNYVDHDPLLAPGFLKSVAEVLRKRIRGIEKQ